MRGEDSQVIARNIAVHSRGKALSPLLQILNRIDSRSEVIALRGFAAKTAQLDGASQRGLMIVGRSPSTHA